MYLLDSPITSERGTTLKKIQEKIDPERSEQRTIHLEVGKGFGFGFSCKTGQVFQLV